MIADPQLKGRILLERSVIVNLQLKKFIEEGIG